MLAKELNSPSIMAKIAKGVAAGMVSATVGFAGDLGKSFKDDLADQRLENVISRGIRRAK